MAEAVENLLHGACRDAPGTLGARVKKSASFDGMFDIAFLFEARQHRANGRILQRSLRFESFLDIGRGRGRMIPDDGHDLLFEFGESILGKHVSYMV